MVIGRLAIEIILLAVCAGGPGLLLAGWVRGSPMEKLCGVFAASFIAIYLASFALFSLNTGAWAYWGVTGVFAVCGVMGLRTAAMLVRRRDTRRTFLCFCVLLAWEFIHLAMIRGYGGGGWGGDWYEHFDRTRFFLHQLPLDFRYLNRYSLASRPPMMNLIAAFFCRQMGLSFEAFSLVFLFLNAWAFVPCCLFLTRIAPRRRLEPVLAALFMLNPSILENVTYTWTKAFAAAWVVLGVCFYLRRRLVPAAVSLAAGILVHYSAVPFAAAVGLHCIFTSIRSGSAWRKAAGAGVAAAALLATWFGWAAVRLGVKATFADASQTTGMPTMALGENLRRMAYNLFTSMIPHPLHPAASSSAFSTLSHVHNWGDFRDYYFTIVQTALPTMMGLFGGIVAAGMLVRMLRARIGVNPWEQRFWLFYLIFAYVVGISVNYGWMEFGTANITLQSLAMMGLTLVAAWLPTGRRVLFRLVLAALAIDYSLGILLQFVRESIVPGTSQTNGRTVLNYDPALGFNTNAEYWEKLRGGYVFWGDDLAGVGAVLPAVSVVGAVGALWVLFGVGARRNRRGRKGGATGGGELAGL